ncbi:DgyrCDS8473 [Dimorphilus gyrociliatus]|uniref:DgyrCDS8473 n=1 Tax=Dimorphilus gyrociliatus TaxID=2664684 RepID=A0A7I8VUB3_9ANNE|nr:DgyrCDS8473 [Dimorphilus gyrociliatus]
MFFKFNNFTGRITQSTNRVTYNPEGLNTTVAQSEQLIFQTKTVKFPVEHIPKVHQVNGPATGKLGVVPDHPGYKKVMELQQRMSKSDGLLVWQKLGSKDKLSYLAIIGGCALGVAYSVRNLYLMTFPKSASD